MSFRLTEDMIRQMSEVLGGTNINLNNLLGDPQNGNTQDNEEYEDNNDVEGGENYDNEKQEDYDNISELSVSSVESDVNNMEKIVIRDINVFVSSLDRDWYNRTDETPYKFNVKLGGNGVQDRYLVTSYEPKNVVSVGVDKMIVSNRNTTINYSNASAEFTRYPYLMLNVDNIDYTTYGTNTKIEKALGLMTPLIPMTKVYPQSNHLEFKNTLGSAKQYYHNPLASLPKLDISITTPLGDNPNNINDVLDVKSIFYQTTDVSNTAAEYLVVQTSTWFFPEQYQAGDVIKFSNYIYRDTSLYSEASNFNTFINDEKGHQIIGYSTSDASKLLKDRIHIATPSSVSTTTGNNVEFPWYVNLKTKSMGTSPVNDTSGKLINTNLQTQSLFKIKVMDKETNFMQDIL